MASLVLTGPCWRCLKKFASRVKDFGAGSLFSHVEGEGRATLVISGVLPGDIKTILRMAADEEIVEHKEVENNARLGKVAA